MWLRHLYTHVCCGITAFYPQLSKLHTNTHIHTAHTYICLEQLWISIQLLKWWNWRSQIFNLYNLKNFIKSLKAMHNSGNFWTKYLVLKFNLHQINRFIFIRWTIIDLIIRYWNIHVKLDRKLMIFLTENMTVSIIQCNNLLWYSHCMLLIIIFCYQLSLTFIIIYQ